MQMRNIRGTLFLRKTIWHFACLGLVGLIQLSLIHPAWAGEGFFVQSDFPMDGTTKSVVDSVANRIIGTNSCAFIPIGKDIVLTALRCLRGTAIFGNTVPKDNSGLILTLTQESKPASILASGGEFPFIHEQLIDVEKWTKPDIGRYKNAYLHDWAILSYPTGNGACLQVRSLPITDSSQILLIAGYPAMAFRTDHPSAGLNKLYFSVGKMQSSLQNNTYVHSLAPGVQRLIVKELGPLISDFSLLLVDADTQSGDSGGSVFDQDGKLVGVVTSGIVGTRTTYEYTPSSAIGISIQSIESQLRSRGIDANKFFDCP
jgi:hypothetical protein